MLVLVAARDPYGTLPADRHFAIEGELVVPVVLECLDQECDVCARAWFGLVSHAGTTAAMVAEREGVTEADLRRLVHDWLDCQGMIDIVVQSVEAGDYTVDGICFDDPVEAVDDLVEAHLREIRLACETFEPGTILSRMGDLVSPRVSRRAA